MLVDNDYDPRDPRARDRNQYGFVLAVCLICCVCIGLVVLVVVLVAATNNGGGNNGGGATFTCASFSDLSQSQQQIVSDCDVGLESTGTCIQNTPGATFGVCQLNQFTGGTSGAPTGAAQSCSVPISDCVEGCQCLGEEVRVCVRNVNLETFPGGTVFQCTQTSPSPTPAPGAKVCGGFRAASVVAQEETISCDTPVFASGRCNAASRCVPLAFANNSDFPNNGQSIVSIISLGDLACSSTECTVAGDVGDPCGCLTPAGAVCEVDAIGTSGGELTANFQCTNPSSGGAAVANIARTPLSKSAAAELFSKK